MHDTTEGVRVTLRDGGTLQADLLVGADGIHSTVRGLVFGAERRYLRYLGFHTAAFVFDDPQIHAEVHGRLCLTDTVDRQMGLYGLRDGRVATFAVHRSADAMLPRDPGAAIRREYGSLGWVIPQALDHCPPAEQVYYDQVAQIELPQWSRRRVVLIGDAGYAVSCSPARAPHWPSAGPTCSPSNWPGLAPSRPHYTATSSCGGRWPRRNSKSPAAGSAGFFHTRVRSCGHDTS